MTQSFQVLAESVPETPIAYSAPRRLLPSSIAPNAGQDKAGRSDFPQFAIRGARGENAENVDRLSFHTKNRDVRKSAAQKRGKFGKFRGFEKGLAGGGWRPTAPKIQQKLSPGIVFSYSQQGKGNRCKRQGLNLWHGGDFLTPTPYVRQPLFKTSEKCGRRKRRKCGKRG